MADAIRPFLFSVASHFPDEAGDLFQHGMID